MWAKMQNILGKLFMTLFIGFWLFLGLKHLVTEGVHFDEDAKYQAKNISTGNVNTVFITTDERIILRKQLGDLFEYGVFRIRGSEPTHYFGPVYNIGESLFGVRVYSDIIAIWNVEMKLIKKEGNLPQSTFDPVGETYYTSYNKLILIRENEIEIGDDKYMKMDLSEDDQIFLKAIKLEKIDVK